MRSYMNAAKEVISKLKLEVGMSPIRAIQKTREYLDRQPDQLKAANDIIVKFGLAPETNRKRAYVFAMTAVDQIINQGNTDKELLLEKSTTRIDSLTSLVGPGAFAVEDQAGTTTVDGVVKPKGKKGSKRMVARELYLEFKSQGDEFVIQKIVEALEVTKQNAYTYVYLVKKDLEQGK